MLSHTKKLSLLVDAAILSGLSYITALATEQLKPGLFSNTMDISILLILTIVLIGLVVLLRPIYSVGRWAGMYYGVWCLALALLFAKLVQRWLGVSTELAVGVVIVIIVLIATASQVYKSKEHHG